MTRTGTPCGDDSSAAEEPADEPADSAEPGESPGWSLGAALCSGTRVHARLADETLPSRSESSVERTRTPITRVAVAKGVPLVHAGSNGSLWRNEAPTVPLEASLDLPFDPLGQFTELHAGVRFGVGDRFEVVRLLGSGGTGLVFLTRDLLLNRLVAAKFARPDVDLPPASVLARFAAEGRTTAKLNHENIVRIFDVGVWHEHPYLVLEYLEGSPLSERLAIRRLSPGRATQIMVEIARALDHAHHAGVLHLDLKPQNVFVLNSGHVKILDFGLWASYTGQAYEPTKAPMSHATAEGTPRYMAPEQWRMAALDQRTDIWAAGVVYLEMLRGSPPFAAVDPSRLFASALSDLDKPPTSSRLGMPRIGERLIESMMSRDPKQRPGSAVDLLLGLDSVQHAILHRPWQRVTRPAHLFAAAMLRAWLRLRLAFHFPSNAELIWPEVGCVPVALLVKHALAEDRPVSPQRGSAICGRIAVADSGRTPWRARSR
jgi:hypothetical protein